MINITIKENTIDKCIELIVGEIIYLTVIQKKYFMKFYGGKEQSVFSQEKLKETLYHMVEIVEGQISTDMKDVTRGSNPHGGCINNGVHFVAIFACYINKVGTYSYYGVIEEPQICFVDFLTIHHIEAHDGDNYDIASDDDDEAFRFSTEVHADYTRKTFEYCKCIAYDKLITCQTSDNARVNSKTGKPLKILHLPCKNNLLNYEVNSMVASALDLHKKME